MFDWCSRLRRRAILVLACLLLAVAAAPTVASEAALARPLVALVCQRAGVSQRSAGVTAPARRERIRVASTEVPRLERLQRDRVERPWARTAAARDERYLYALHDRLLC